MTTVQNLDVHGTFGVRQVSLESSFLINALVIWSNGVNALAEAGRTDQLDRYRFDPNEESCPEHAQAPIVEGLLFSGGPSTASHMPAARREETQ